MTVDPRFARLIAAVLSPVLLPQARLVRRSMPNLPPAAQPWQGSVDGREPLSVLILGDSTAAGVGTATMDEALPGNLARRLSNEWERGVIWRAVAESGATTKDIVGRFLDDASSQAYDLVFVSIGANDALQVRSRAAFRRNFRTIIRRLRSVSPKALILVSCLPRFSQFESLPNPLRWALDLHSQALERTARALVANEPGIVMSPPAPLYAPGFFATDRFHPSAQGYREWVDFALTDAKLVRAAAS